MTTTDDEIVQWLREATTGFDNVFSNDIVRAREVLSSQDTPFHAMGLGVCAFLEAALGMETGLMAEAVRCLTLAEAGAKKQIKAKANKHSGRFPAGIEWEVLLADTVILSGMTNALSESYMGYMQCLYALNSAHTKFSKLYKTVFPSGLDAYSTPAPSRKPSHASLASVGLTQGSASGTSTPSRSGTSTPRSGLFGRLLGTSNTPVTITSITGPPDGPIEELIVSGTAFGYGLFNLIFSLLPAKVRGVVGFLGFQHDRKLALRALAVSAALNDVHSVFAGLGLMTYHGIVLLLSGYQANEASILKQYRTIVDKLEAKYPTGSLWILNRAKILRMSGDAEAAISVLQDGLRPGRPVLFQQADALLVFELAWTLLSHRRYQEASDMFIRMTEINSWSHGTYYFIAAGCQVSLGNLDKAKEFFDQVPNLIEKKKLGGKDLPTEVFIKKKLEFYRKKHQRRTGSEDGWVQSIKISPAEELGIFWNTHTRVSSDVCVAHIREWNMFTPPPEPASPLISDSMATQPGANASPDLDTPDELALRELLLGIVHRTVGQYDTAQSYLQNAHARQSAIQVSTWIGGVAMFELAVLGLRGRDAQATENEAAGATKERWAEVLKEAEGRLDKAAALAGNAVDLSSRLDMRINMLRDEIALKREMLGMVA